MVAFSIHFARFFWKADSALVYIEGADDAVRADLWVAAALVDDFFKVLQVAHGANKDGRLVVGDVTYIEDAKNKVEAAIFNKELHDQERVSAFLQLKQKAFNRK